ncbi:MAG: DoxX family protein [Bacteroidetes bacterium]|nr:MAG: DoxX family protein [Bacteroidota bacterium]
MNNSTLARIGTIIYAIAVIIFGVMHFMHASVMSGMVPGYFPGGVIWVYLAGAGLVLAGIAFLINKYSRIAGILLGLMLILFILVIHLPHHLHGDGTSLAMILKDAAMAGAAFVIASRGN